jgi:hypothetical protein
MERAASDVASTTLTDVMPSEAPDPSPKRANIGSWRNAVRHGLCAETVVGTLEDIEDYKGFAAATQTVRAVTAAQPPRRLVARSPAQRFLREVRDQSAGNIKTARSWSLAKLPRPGRLRFNRDGARLWKAAAQTFCLRKVILGAGLCASIRKCGSVVHGKSKLSALRAGAHGRFFIF